jgi:hypothetical protein
MARTALTNGIQTVPATGLELLTEAITTDGKQFPNQGSEYVYIQNDSGATRTITFQTPLLIDGDLTVAERTVSVETAEFRLVSNLTPSTYNQPTGADAGQVYVDADVATSVVIAVFR